MEKVVIFGATSRIAQELGRQFASENAEIFLVGRGRDRLELLQNDLLARGAHSIQVQEHDFLNQEAVELLVETIKKKMSTVDVIVLAFGVLGQPEKTHSDFRRADEVIQTNLNASIALCLASRTLLQQGSTLAYLSSVAGDRARRSNFVYGASKAGMNFFLDGYRLELLDAGIYVTNIKLGPVNTPMTMVLKSLPFMISPENAAENIRAAIKAKKREAYIPSIWFWIMTVIRLLPFSIFKKLNF